MGLYFLVFCISLLMFVVWAVLCRFEESRQRRLLLPRMRNWIDSLLISGTEYFKRHIRYIIRFLFTLSWYYGVHALLKAGLRFIAKVYFVLEHLFEKNRTRTKQLRREQREQNSYLGHLNQHKSNVKLSDKKQAAIKKRALQGE